MKKHYFLSLLLASFLLFLSFHGVHAANTSISGDDVCGGLNGPKCNIFYFKKVIRTFLITIVSIGAVLTAFFIAFRLLQAELAARQGNPAARGQAIKNILNGFLGLAMILAVVGGVVLYAFKLLGVQSWVGGFLQFLSSAFVEHAYAAEQYLPNALGSNNLFDLILAAVNLAVKFFIYPAIVVLWVWSGFQFVLSQGNPDGLKKAKSWIMWTFLITIVMFTLQGFTLALRNTMAKIAPDSAALIENPTAPRGEAVSQTTTVTPPVTDCRGQANKTPCVVSGRRGECGISDPSESSGGVFSCYAIPGQ